MMLGLVTPGLVTWGLVTWGLVTTRGPAAAREWSLISGSGVA